VKEFRSRDRRTHSLFCHFWLAGVKSYRPISNLTFMSKIT